MEDAINTQHGDRIEGWPTLPYEAWRDTCQTLHMWTQIVGKVRYDDVRNASSPQLCRRCWSFSRAPTKLGPRLGSGIARRLKGG